MRTIAYFLLGLLLGGMAAVAMAEPIVTDSTSKSETTVKSPPPSAISPNITTINNYNCSTGLSGAVQTQILGISMGSTVRDLNCEMLLKSRELYSQQMKAPATTVLCQDANIWWGMWDSGVYCPIEGKFGISAKEFWEANPKLMPDRPKIK
jgi:hypothetical protein